MDSYRKLLVWICIIAPFSAVRADTHYVSPSGSDVAPYTTWGTAAHNIQSGVNSAVAGDTVLVADGIYTGGQWVAFGMTNRLVVTNSVNVMSVNGPASAIIAGQGPAGAGAIRCAALDNGALLAGFTLSNGNTQVNGNYTADNDGGGVYCRTLGAGTISNCVIIDCHANNNGGGVFYGLSVNCQFSGNSAGYGGAAYRGELRACIVSNNTAAYGGGTFYSTVSNCVVTGCKALIGGGSDGGTLHGCTISGNQATNYYGGGSCQATLDRCLISGNSANGDGGGDYGSTIRNSLIRDNQAGGSGGGVCSAGLVGCTVVSNRATQNGGGCSGGNITNSIVYFNTASGQSNNMYNTSAAFSCSPAVSGGGNITNDPLFVNASAADFRLSAGSPCIDAGTNLNAGKDLAGLLRPQDGNSDQLFLSDIGAYEFPPDSPYHYVSLGGLNIYPYTNWAGASTTLQAAVDAASGGDVVMVSNGVYSVGSAVSGDGTSNRVLVLQALRLQSSSGPADTVIAGAGPIGNAAVRCAYLAAGATLDGFTLSNGYTRASGGWITAQAGGGAWCAEDAVLTNCVLGWNSASGVGGSLYGGRAYSCVFTSNVAGDGSGSGAGGAAGYAWLYKCLMIRNQADEYGGGCYQSMLVDSDLIANTASNVSGNATGGGAYNCVISDSLISGNYAHGSAGGVYGGALSNCVVATNRCRVTGGGVYGCTVQSSVVSSNYAASTGGGTAYSLVTGSTIAGNTGGSSGGGSYYGSNINCQVLDNRSTNGWGGGGCETVMIDCTVRGNQCTVIGGGGLYGGSASNCVFAANRSGNGGGLYLCSSCVNSTIVSNDASSSGGGAAYSALRNCTIYSNKAHGATDTAGGGGTFAGSAVSCLYSNNWSDGGGGGANGTFITNSVLMNNWTRLGGGGAAGGSLYNCLVVSNYCNNQGGGLYNSIATHCTIVSNGCWGEGGGTAYRMNLTNCIVYHNRSFVMGVDHNNYLLLGYYAYTCTYPDPGGPGNKTNEPRFADFNARDFRLTQASPCIDAGVNAGSTADINGVPRPLDGDTNGVALPDLGAYEFASPLADSDGDGISDEWEMLHGLSPVGSSDAAVDSDGDGISNSDEWIADTNPTNSRSYFEIAAVSNMPQPTLYFVSSSSRHYSLEYTTNLTGGVWTGVPGLTNIASAGAVDHIADTNGDGFRCYRLRVTVP